MQDQWYGDKRDLVKWGTLLELARIYQVKEILQVLYHRSNTWYPIEVDGKLVRISDEVIQHFRDSKSIVNLKSPVAIEVLDEKFADRKRYLQSVIGKLQYKKEIKKIVFLDPDTGIEPAGKPSLKHVLESELKMIWDSLSQEDVLVFYCQRENPRLCRGGSSSLTFPGVHPETLQGEPPSTRRGETGWTSMLA
jgi:hypothetical protein